MTKLMQAQKVKYAVLNAPYLIPLYFKPPYNPMITRGILHKMLNRSCGIEIECFGSLSNGRRVDYRDIIEYYGLTDYREDHPHNPEDCPTDFNEHKIRIKDYSQLRSLYDILNDMKSHCKLNLGSGIHIHVNMEDYRGHRDEWGRERLKEIFKTRLDEVEKIFYPTGSYTGTYNVKTASRGKTSSWVNIRDCTIEFRIAPMTFEYTNIVKWCVELNKLVNNVLNSEPRIAIDSNVRPRKIKPAKPKPIDKTKHENQDLWDKATEMIGREEAERFFRNHGYEIPPQGLGVQLRDCTPIVCEDRGNTECEACECRCGEDVESEEETAASHPNIRLRPDARWTDSMHTDYMLLQQGDIHLSEFLRRYHDIIY